MSSETPEEVTEQAAEETTAPEQAGTETAVVESETPTISAEGSVAGLTLGQGGPADEALAEAPELVLRGKIDRFGVAMGTGRRKTAVARVRIKDGDGKITVNGRTLEEYFGVERDRLMILAVLEATGVTGKVDIWVRANGGGTTGQTGAVILGIARALQARDQSLHHTLSSSGYLTRDGRMVERKKYGLRKARRSFQFSKR